jgi:hypothetical protein
MVKVKDSERAPGKNEGPFAFPKFWETKFVHDTAHSGGPAKAFCLLDINFPTPNLSCDRAHP